MFELVYIEFVLQYVKIYWDYEGVGGLENWFNFDLKNIVCVSGQCQLLIDICDGIQVDVELIVFKYCLLIFCIVDNGCIVQVVVGDSLILLIGKIYELV